MDASAWLVVAAVVLVLAACRPPVMLPAVPDRRQRTMVFLVAVVTFVPGPRPPWASAGDAEVGREVYRANCAMCHGADASGMTGMHPSLRGAVQRLSREGVEVTIRQGRATSPPMPAWEGRLRDAQIDAVIAYVASLPPGPRNFGADQAMPGREGPMMGDRHPTDDREDAGMMSGGRMMGAWMGVLWLLWALLLVALIVLAVVAVLWLLRNPRDPGRGLHAGPPRSLAREELDRRYAAGELSRDDYLQRRRDLEG
ncbi:MAG TPA: c-type cytochrome [Egibacteraceae bacterium]|nr:c-type cytochrome [Egibacteraceae bacterium]